MESSKCWFWAKYLPSLLTSLVLTQVSGQPLRTFTVPFPNLSLDSCKVGSASGFWIHPGPKRRHYVASTPGSVLEVWWLLEALFSLPGVELPPPTIGAFPRLGVAPPITGIFPKVKAASSHHHPSDRASFRGEERPESLGSVQRRSAGCGPPSRARDSWRPRHGLPHHHGKLALINKATC